MLLLRGKIFTKKHWIEFAFGIETSWTVYFEISFENKSELLKVELICLMEKRAIYFLPLFSTSAIPSILFSLFRTNQFVYWNYFIKEIIFFMFERFIKLGDALYQKPANKTKTKKQYIIIMIEEVIICWVSYTAIMIICDVINLCLLAIQSTIFIFF